MLCQRPISALKNGSTPRKKLQFCDDGQIRSNSEPSSLPKPMFINEPKSFSTKKQRGTPPLRPPPRPQAKTCPPVSRIFKRRPEMFAAQSVTFLDSGESSSLTGTPFPSSAVYDSAKKASYFEQAFTIEGKIGAGCFGTVYKVRSKEDGHLYAVKIARECYRGQSDRAEKLEEVRKHQFLLPHSNCVHFYQSWEENGRLYQQFELCQKSLMELSEEKHDLPESLIWAYLVDLLLAVQHLHDHDLIHMDIKPENIFIGMDGICKLGDFGLVIDLAKTDASHAIEGDPRYLATEVLQNRKFSKAADIFALGVTILELACDLDLPKHGYLWHQLRQTGPDPNMTKYLSPDLRRVIQLMMGNDPERRPTVKQLLALPSIRKARAKRARSLAITNMVYGVSSTLQSWTWPLYCMLATFFRFILSPLFSVKKRLRRLFFYDSRMSTPVQVNPDGSGITFVAPPAPADTNGASFSSDEDDLFERRSSFSSPHTSVLASPLTLHFSDDDEEEEKQGRPKANGGSSSSKKKKKAKKEFELPTPIIGRRRNRVDVSRADDLAKKAMSAPQLNKGQPTQSTPTSVMGRFRSRQTSGKTPGMSPKKRLDFDCYDHDGSPKLPNRYNSVGGSSSNHGGDLTPTSTRSSRSSRLQPHDTSSYQADVDEEDLFIKPISLAAKFDCFSDSD